MCPERADSLRAMVTSSNARSEPDLDGSEWRVAVVAGTDALGDVQPTIEFGDGSVFGQGSVNRYRGSYAIEHGRLVVGQVATTMMAGPEPAMRQEQRWFRALAEPSVIRPVGRDGSTIALDHSDATTSRLVRIGTTVVVRGTVAYLARIAMLPGSVLTVVLEDAALADAPATTVAEQRIDEPGNVPVAFELRVDPAAVPERAELGLRARIEVDGTLRWITDTHHRVDLADEPQPHELIVWPADPPAR